MRIPVLSPWKVTVLVLCAALAWDYAPVFTGRIPFPSFFIYVFPAFGPLAPPDLNTRVANVGDLLTSFYPYRTLAARAWTDGLPLWNPYLLSGVPFLANPQSALFYPLNALYYFLPVALAWCLGFLLRVFLAGFFTALLMRRIGASIAGSLVAALLFTYSGFMTVWQGQAMLDAAIWLPLICYAVVRLHEDHSAASVAIASLAFAMPVLAGHPETAAHLTVMGVGLALFLGFLRPDSAQPRRPFRYLALFSAAGLLAVGLAGVQILPTVEWLPHINRGFDDRWPAAPLWAALGYVSRDILRDTNSFGLQIPEHAAYVGMFAFLVFPMAWLDARKRYIVFFTLSTVAAFCTAYGISPVLELSHRIPLIGGLKNHRLILVVTFGVAVLAGLGTTALERMAEHDYKSRVRAGMSAAVGFVLAFLMIYVMRLYVEDRVEPSRFPRVSLFLLVISAAVVTWRLIGGLRGRRFACTAVLMVGVDVCSFAYGFLPFDKPERAFPENEIFSRLSPKTPALFRLSEIGGPYITNAELVYAIPSATGYEIPLRRITRFIAGAAQDQGDAVMLDAELLLNAKDRRIDMLSTKYFAVSHFDPASRKFHERADRFKFLFEYGKTDVFENLTVLPPAIVVPSSGIVVENDEERQLGLIRSPGFDPQRTVVLGEPMPKASAQGAPGNATWISRDNTTFRLKVDSPQDGVLVLSQIFYPGWKASVDGEQTHVFPANYGLTGIAVGPGSHDVVFWYSPSSFKLGLLLSISALVIIVGLLRSAGLERRNENLRGIH